MGNNACGCVRTPKEDYYVDPRKAPLSPSGQKEHQGRRYFQRKKRKSEVLQHGDEPPSPAAGDATDEPVGAKLGSADVRGGRVGEPRAEPRPGTTEGTPSDRGSASSDRAEVHRARASVDDEPPGGTGGRRGGRGGEGKRDYLPWHGLKRAVSLGAAEQTLLGSTRGYGGAGRGSEENFSAETRQCKGRALRGRRRARSCSGYGERAQASRQGMSANHEVTFKYMFIIDNDDQDM